MAYNNFIPTIWEEAINRELETLCVFAEDCNRSYEGSVKKHGDQVTILGVGKPTIKKISKAKADADIDKAEKVESTASTMIIDEIRYFNYMVGDIDKSQAVKGVMEALSKETSEGLANEVDRYIASFAADSAVESLYADAKKVSAKEDETDAEYVLDVIDKAIQKLQENNVGSNTDIVVTISPRFYRLFKKAYRTEDTNNSGILKNGKIAQYGNVTVKMSNNVLSKDGVDNIMIRTKRAIAYVQPLTHTEAYRPENNFADAVKGYILFKAKVVRPKEIVNINVKY